MTITNLRCTDVFSHDANGNVCVWSFCFPKTAIREAREAGLTEFVVTVAGRVVHVEGAIEPVSFMWGRP